MSGVDERETGLERDPQRGDEAGRGAGGEDPRGSAEERVGVDGDAGTGWPTTPAEIPLDGPSEAPLDGAWAPPHPSRRTQVLSSEPRQHRQSRNPVDRLTRGLPDPVRIVVDWVVTIVGAVAIVLLVKAFVVNPYRIPSSSMEPTLHCAKPASGCEARFSDRVLANRFIYHLRDPRRGEIIVFDTPDAARVKCGAGGTFVKRLIGLPGETVEVRLKQGEGYVFINGKQLREPYIQPRPAADRGVRPGQGGAEPLLHDGRQPLAVLRLPRVGHRPARQPHRQGVRDLLAAQPSLAALICSRAGIRWSGFLPLGHRSQRNPQERIPPLGSPPCGRGRSLKASPFGAATASLGGGVLCSECSRAQGAVGGSRRSDPSPAAAAHP